jgi:hypothetical protein
VRGKVIDPAGTVRAFLPLVQCIESQPVALVSPDGVVSHSATIIRGPQGALFPNAGLYRIVVEVQWDEGSVTRGLTGAADMLVVGASTREQAEVAYEILSTPDTIMTIAASTSDDSGVKAIDRAIKDPTLGPHYAWLDAKRRCRTNNAAESLDALQRLSRAKPVMSSAERLRAVEMLDRVAAEPAGPESRAAAKPAVKARGAKAQTSQLSKVVADLRAQFVKGTDPGGE